MDKFWQIAVDLMGTNPGVTSLLFILCGILSWAYWQEKKKNEDVATERLDEVREDTKEMMSALHEATTTIREFKSSNEALRHAFETLTRSVERKGG
jgi:predicted negative regulator of RcsB-dependent stress response